MRKMKTLLKFTVKNAMFMNHVTINAVECEFPEIKKFKKMFDNRKFMTTIFWHSKDVLLVVSWNMVQQLVQTCLVKPQES